MLNVTETGSPAHLKAARRPQFMVGRLTNFTCAALGATVTVVSCAATTMSPDAVAGEAAVKAVNPVTNSARIDEGQCFMWPRLRQGEAKTKDL
jgi:hypothetical protein